MSTIKDENLKNKLRQNELTIGSWINLAHPAIAEMMSEAGFDWLTIDLEHSTITIREAEDLIRVINLKGVSPLVRLTSNNSDLIKRVMDSGAHGIIVPMVNNDEQAKCAVQSIKYPPQGNRGVGLARAQGYGFAFEEYAESINEKSVVIVQIEHIEAINNLEKILSVEGVDGSIIGPYDLSGSMGKPGKYEDEDVKQVLEQYEIISKKMKKTMGYHIIKPDYNLVIEKIKKGYHFIAFSTDFLFLGNTCRDQMKNLKNKLI